MRRTWTILGVGDVPGSFKWYQSLLGLPETRPAHDYYCMCAKEGMDDLDKVPSY
jgi:hypothetical protein